MDFAAADSNAEQRIIARINDEIGADFKKLRQATTLVQHYRQRIQHIELKLNYEAADSPSNFKSALDTQCLLSASIEFQLEKLQQFAQKLQIQIVETSKTLNAVQPQLQQIRQLQQLMRYLRIVQDIQEISQQLQHAVQHKDEAKMCNLYLSLYESSNDFENSIIGRLQQVTAPHLKLFAQRTASYWYALLKNRFCSELETALKHLNWGQRDQNNWTQSTFRDAGGNNMHSSKAQLLAEYLFMLKSPAEETPALEMITNSIICQPLSDVSKLLLAPYKKRFIYHFTGVRQTNRLDKPEWFFTQILNWGKEAHLFVGKVFQPAVINAGKLDFNIRLEFLRGLTQLAIEKLSVDIEIISSDDNLFAHLIDEILAFEMELRDIFDYPASFPSAISVITQPVYLRKWIALEENFCAEKMDGILSDNPWQLIDAHMPDEEQLKIPQCADHLLRLLEAIKERYYALLQPGHKLQFLKLQLELLENFRIRLVQLHSNDKVHSIPILNAINYIVMVLREWGENVHYLHLNAMLMGANADEIQSVFEQPVHAFEHWSAKLMKELVKHVSDEIKSKTKPYRDDNWSQMPEQNMQEPQILSASAGEMFQVLVTIIHHLECELSTNLLRQCLHQLALELDEYFYEFMILYTKFSKAGAMQFNYDMTRNLFVLFGQYFRRPETLFKRIHDAKTILCAARGTALLLHETLRAKNMQQQQKLSALKELGILELKPSACLEVLERRSDIQMF